MNKKTFIGLLFYRNHDDDLPDRVFSGEKILYDKDVLQKNIKSSFVADVWLEDGTFLERCTITSYGSVCQGLNDKILNVKHWKLHGK